MSARIRLLHVDDDPGVAGVVARFLEQEEPRIEVEAVTDTRAALERVADGEFDCVVSDYDMPETNGIEFLEAIRGRDPEVPFILYTGKGSEEVASEAISRGVTDYLQKTAGRDQYAVLANRVVNAVTAHRTAKDLERRGQQEEAIASLSQAALGSFDLEPLFDRAVEMTADLLGTAYSNLLECADDGTTCRIVAGHGWDDGVVGTTEVETGRNSLPGYALSTTEPVVVEELRTESRFEGRSQLTDHGVVSGVCVVVGSADDPWGVLGVYTTSQRDFGEDDVRFVQNVANVLATAIDRHRIEQRHRESETRFREIAELGPDTIFRLDADGVFTYVSPVVESLLGYEPAALLGTNFGRYVADGSQATAVEGFTRVREGEVVRELEVELVDADGTTVDAEVSASPVVHDGEITLVQGLVRDITARKQRERELRTLKAQYETLVEHIPDRGVFLFDHHLRYQLAGGAELAAVGFTAADFEGKTPHDLFPEAIADETVHYYREALAGRAHTYEQTYRGDHYQIETVPVRDESGAVVSGLAVSQNVTERKARHRRLKRQNERLTEFAGIVSHDLRNPLSVAQGRVTLAKQECADCEQLDHIEVALQRSQSLVDDLFELARSGEPVRATVPVSLAEVVKRCWNNVPTEDASLVVETTALIEADRGRLEQLFENLFRNAVEHGGADVTVTVGSTDDGFYVADTGSGIPAELRGQVFESSASSGGRAGYGLRIVKQIVDAHGWEITHREDATDGARFDVTGVTQPAGTDESPTHD
jgi:PAS domain S-box-containing protein